MLDDIDKKIITLLQQNARIPNAEIARQIGMAPSAILERIRKLEEQGVILGYEAKLNPKALGLGLLAFVFIKAEKPDRTGELLGNIPGVQEVHNIAGEDCFLVKVRTEGTEELGKLLHDEFRNVGSVTGTKPTIVLTTLKETAQLVIPEASAEGKNHG